jgi:beta-N-acetylhexosaminidase
MDIPGTPLARRRTVLAGAGAAVASLAVGTPAQEATAAAGAIPKGLTNRQFAGQRVIYSYPGHTPPADLLKKISAGEAAGVIFFGENITSEKQIASVIKQLVKANARSPVQLPLLLMTDQEGGQLRRLPGAPVLSEKQIGNSAHPLATAKSAGTGAGKNLAGVGMNVNLAPVLDVYRKAGDFIDRHQRSYGTHAAQVGALGAAFTTAQQHTGVAATAKHFPGLGAATANQNTDAGPVKLSQSLTVLRTVDEAPYKQAIAAGVKLVMVSWAVYPALDAHHPAGLSATVIQKELRTRLGFKGVTVTDALEAGALGHSYSTGRRAVLAAGAGMDLLLCSARKVSQGEATVTALTNALRDGTLGSTSFRAAVSRLTTLRAGLR